MLFVLYNEITKQCLKGKLKLGKVRQRADNVYQGMPQ